MRWNRARRRLEKTYRDRLDFERHRANGLSRLFPIVADFIQWAKEQGIPWARAVVADPGCLLADHHRSRSHPFNLLFERSLNPERVSMPDFDIDFVRIAGTR